MLLLLIFLLMQELEKQYGNVVFIKVDVDKAQEIAKLEGISAMPTFKFFKNGEKVNEVVGASEAKIKEAVEKLLQQLKIRNFPR